MISVIMSVYKDSQENIDKTIKSILSQTFKDFEFIIIKDGFDFKIPKDDRIRIISNKKNIGLTKSLNKGIKISKGEFIARIDSGDTAEISRLKKQRDYLIKHPGCGVVGTWTNIVNLNGKILRKIKNAESDENIRKVITYKNQFVHSSLMLRKEMIGEGYDENFKYAQDYELVLRIMKENEGHNIPEFLTNYLYDEESISYNKSRDQEKFAIKAMLKGIKEYGFNFNIKIIKPLMIFLLPNKIKILIKRSLNENN